MRHKVTQRTSLQRRTIRTRNRVRGTADRPRLCVVRSAKHIYCQIIDDDSGQTLAAVNTTAAAVRQQVGKTWNKDAAKAIGKLIADKGKEKGVTKVVFDRGGRQYHGRLAALADAARENGLVF